jgi:hypothetical protein
LNSRSFTCRELIKDIDRPVSIYLVHLSRQRDFWYEQEEAWYEQADAFFDPDIGRTFYYPAAGHPEIEEIDIQIEKYVSCMGYHVALYDARVAAFRAEIHQTKLDKLLLVQQKYF